MPQLCGYIFLALVVNLLVFQMEMCVYFSMDLEEGILCPTGIVILYLSQQGATVNSQASLDYLGCCLWIA